MKTLKFRRFLADEILERRKTVTWRLFDDKDLKVGDGLDLIEWESGKKFAEVEITEVREKILAKIEDADFEGHEKFESREAMLREYQKYYGDKVTMDTPVKIIRFSVINKKLS
ncbi:ASCH domain-containing protein [Candidatus Azambacteria bacterium]|nr:ASCH domain-containing protein [Candidatus Azambacteria bacterium]